MAPAVSMDWSTPKAPPRRSRGTDSESITSRGAPRNPFASRSAKRMNSTCHHEVASASSGFMRFATA